MTTPRKNMLCRILHIESKSQYARILKMNCSRSEKRKQKQRNESIDTQKPITNTKFAEQIQISNCSTFEIDRWKMFSFQI